MARDHPWPVILLPGGILPVGPAYAALLAELGDTVDARPKDLEIYAGPTVPPPGYSLEIEVEGVRHFGLVVIARAICTGSDTRVEGNAGL